MRSRTSYILLLAILAAVAVVAIGSEGQTPPPPSGDWEVADDTAFSDTQLDVHGSITVLYGASLTLTNVDLNLVGDTMAIIRAESGGTLVWDGGNLTYTYFYPPRLMLVSGCSVNGVAFGGLYGVSVLETDVSFTNCTVEGTDSIGVQISMTVDTPLEGPITIANNTFTNIARAPIAGWISSNSNSTLDLVIVGNRVDGVSSSDAINLTVDAQRAHIVMDRNTVSNGAYGGIALQVQVDDLYLRMNGNSVQNVVGNGIYLTLIAQDLDFDGMSDTRVEDAGNIGLAIWSTWAPIDVFTLANHTNLGAGRIALQLAYAYRVTLVNSRIETNGTNFNVINGTMDIYRSTFERGNARVLVDGRITSWKWLDMTCEWEGGIPIANRRVDVVNSSGVLLLSAVTDKDGQWANKTYADWEETPTTSTIIYQLRPVLVHPAGNIEDGALSTGADQTVTITFDDPAPPVLKVQTPAGDVRQNTTSLVINGSCSDPYSGVALVQFSLDPNPDWASKVWTDATGTERWYVDTLFLSEGEYTLYLRAFDRSGMVTGNRTELVVGTVVIDQTPPVITVTSPDPGRQPLLVNTTTVTVTGWVSEQVSSISVQRMSVPLPGTLFELEASVSEGLNELVITATDLAGNTARYTITVLRDTTPPSITLTAPASGALLNVTSVHVAGLLDDSMPGDHVVVNGVIATLSGDAFQVLLKGFDEGPGSIDVTAVDLAGNTATLSVDVIIDSLPPALKLVSPSDGLLTRQATVLLEGTTEAGAHITVQGTPVEPEGTSFTFLATLVEGRNLVRVTSVDDAGNSNSTFVVVVRDSIAPLLEVTGVVEGPVEAEGTMAYINGRTEPGATLLITVGEISTQVLTFRNGSFVHPLLITDNGTWVTLRAEDEAGNTAFLQMPVDLGETVGPPSTPPTSPVDEVVTATVVTTSILVMVGVAMSFEFTKYALLLMVLPLYARIKKHEVLDNKTRLAIHGLVVENPGLHYNEIIREFDLTNGVAAYHLDVLEREGFIRSIRDGTLRRFYSSATKVPGSHKATPDQTREQILELVSTNPGINQKSIVDELGIGRTLVGYHLKTLIDEGYIEGQKEGRFTVYSRTRKRWFRLN